MTVSVAAKRLRRGTYVVRRDGEALLILPVYRKSRKRGEVRVRGKLPGSAVATTWRFDPDDRVEVLTVDEEAGMGLSRFRRWWQAVG